MACLGIDTSNYTSSVAVASENKILLDNRQILKVAKGEKGLRQSDALYQHWENLPKLIRPAFEFDIDSIVVSVRPRPQAGSYMPVFNAGAAIADITGNALKVPVYRLSHQEGHILAASYENNIDFKKPLVCAHLSGGTIELVKIENGKFKIIGNTKDISYGQLIDRAGVMLGLDFPAGKEIDKMALKAAPTKLPFKSISVSGSELNISGFETQIKKYIEEKKAPAEIISYFVMKAVSESFIKIIQNTKIDQVLVTGGVASSEFLRRECEKYGYIFGNKNLCSDNAAGLALSGGIVPWQ